MGAISTLPQHTFGQNRHFFVNGGHFLTRHKINQTFCSAKRVKFAITRFVASLKATIIASRFATSSTTTMTTPRFAPSLKASLGIKICNKLEGNNGICSKLENNNGICKKLENSKLEGSNNCPLELLFICECLLALLKLDVWHLSNLFASLKVW